MSLRKFLLFLSLLISSGTLFSQDKLSLPADPFYRSQLLLPRQSKDLQESTLLQINESAKLGFASRIRFEQKENAKFSKTLDGSSSFTGQTSQVWFAAAPTENLALKITIQDSRLWGGSRLPSGDTGAYGLSTSVSSAPNAAQGDKNFTDIREAFLVLSHQNFHAILGRQILAFGDQRLFGGRNWLNGGNSFDAARFSYKSSFWNSDLFIATLTENSNGPNSLNSFSVSDTSRQDSDTYTGGWHNVLVFSDLVIEGYWFALFRNRIPVIRDSNGNVVANVTNGRVKDHKHTFGSRITNRVKTGKPDGKFDYTFEGAIQIGDSGEDTYLGNSGSGPLWGERKTYFSGMFVAQTGYQILDSLHLGAQWIYASGDNDRSDAKNRTFDPMFGNRHSLFPYWNIYQGEMDAASTRNLMGYSFNVLWEMVENWQMVVTIQDIHKAAANDAWYGANGSSNQLTGENWSSSGGNSTGEHNYTEMDMVLLAYPIKYCSFSLGVSVIYAGSAVESLRKSDFAPWGEFAYFTVNASI